MPAPHPIPTLVQRMIKTPNDDNDNDETVVDLDNENGMGKELIFEEAADSKKKGGCTLCRGICITMTLIIVFVLGAVGRHEYALMYEHYSLPEFNAVHSLFAGNDNTAEVCGNYGKFACNGFSVSKNYLRDGSVASTVQQTARSRAMHAYTSEIATLTSYSPAAAYFAQCITIASSASQIRDVSDACELVAANNDYYAMLRAGFAVEKIRLHAVLTPESVYRAAFVFDNLPLHVQGVTVTADDDPCNLLELYRKTVCTGACTDSSIYIIGPMSDVCASRNRIMAQESSDSVFGVCLNNILLIAPEQCLDMTAKFWNEPSATFVASQVAERHATQVVSLAVNHTLDEVQNMFLGFDGVVGQKIKEVKLSTGVSKSSFKNLDQTLFGNTFVETFANVNQAALASRLSAARAQLSPPAVSEYALHVPAWSVFPAYNSLGNILYAPLDGLSEWSTALDPATNGRVAFLVSRTLLTVLHDIPHGTADYSRVLKYASCLGLDSSFPRSTLDAVANHLAFEISRSVASRSRHVKSIAVEPFGSVTWSMQSTMAAASMMCTTAGTVNNVRSNVPDYLQLSQVDISLATTGMHSIYGCASARRVCRL